MGERGRDDRAPPVAVFPSGPGSLPPRDRNDAGWEGIGAQPDRSRAPYGPCLLAPTDDGPSRVCARGDPSTDIASRRRSGRGWRAWFAGPSLGPGSRGIVGPLDAHPAGSLGLPHPHRRAAPLPRASPAKDLRGGRSFRRRDRLEPPGGDVIGQTATGPRRPVRGSARGPSSSASGFDPRRPTTGALRRRPPR